MTEFPLEGGCACRRVRYRLTSAPLYVHGCHCRSCQRETGTAFALNAMIEAERVESLGDAPDLVDTPSASGEGQVIARCAQCRVAIWSVYTGSGPLVRFVRVGTLDEPARLPPDIHIFTSSKHPWVELPEGTPAVHEFYDRERYWPAASLERRKALLPGVEAYRKQLEQRQVVHSRTFEAPREGVFAAFENPSRLARWWGPQGFTSTFETFEPWAGGRWIFTMHGPDGRDYPNENVFLDILRPDHVRLRHVSVDHGFDMLITLVDAGDGRTKVRWRQRFATAEHCAQVADFVRVANEQNLDRWQAVVAET